MGKKCVVARNIGLVVPLLGIMLELLLGRCPAARYVRLPGCPEICPAARKYARLFDMPGCPAARYARLPGNMPGCSEICPVARKYARLPGNMSGCLELCPAVRKYARLPGCPEICPECPAPRQQHHGWTPNASLQRRRWRPPEIGTSAGVPRRHTIAPSSGAAPAASAAKQCWAA